MKFPRPRRSKKTLPPMKIKNLHPWGASPKEAAEIQKNLAAGVSLKGNRRLSLPGVDISFSKHSAFAGVVLLGFPAMNVAFTLADELTFPYIPVCFLSGKRRFCCFEKYAPSRT